MGAKLEAFYLEAYKRDSNLAIQRNDSIIFHNSQKLLNSTHWESSRCYSMKNKTNILTHRITSYIRAQTCSMLTYNVLWSVHSIKLNFFIFQLESKQRDYAYFYGYHLVIANKVLPPMTSNQLWDKVSKCQGDSFILLLVVTNFPLRWSSSVYQRETSFLEDSRLNKAIN